MSARVAIIANTDDLLLEALLEAWADSVLLDTQIVLVSPAANVDETVLYNGSPLAFVDIADFDFGQVDGVIVLCPAIVVEAYKSILAGLSCPVLGFMDSLACLQPVLFDEGVSEGAVVVGVLQAPVAALQYVLADISSESIDVTVLYPASLYGRQGVQELATQTTRLLNVQPVEGGVFEEQLPFNYYPMSANSVGEHLEEQLLEELGLVFVGQDIHVTAMQMPVFYGVSMLVSAVLENEAEPKTLQGIWSKKQLISYQDSAKQLSNISALDHNGRIILGNVRKSHADNYRIDFWIGLDDVKFSANYNLISAAEFLLKHHL